MEPYWRYKGEMKTYRIFKNGEDTGRRIEARCPDMALEILEHDWDKRYDQYCWDIETTIGYMMAVIHACDEENVQDIDIYEALEEE